MINLTQDYKHKVIEALFEQRKNFTGSDTKFAKQYGVHPSVYSRLKKGEIEGVLSPEMFLTIGRQLNVSTSTRPWKIVRTHVYNVIEQDIDHCQTYSKSMVFVDEADIGKSESARHIARNRTNCFYIDCSQAKKARQFVKEIARVIGVSTTGTFENLKAEIKYYLTILPNPVIILDEAGDLEYQAFLLIKEFWNATEDKCGWYMMGAEGLKSKMSRGIEREKVGYTEIFSRFSGKFSSAVPKGNPDRLLYYRDLVSTVMDANVTTQTETTQQVILNRCIEEYEGKINGLRRLKSLLILKK